jgi:N-acetylmuramoyl-L-alanine amidase
MRVDESGWLATEEGDPELVQIPSARHSALAVPAPVAMVWHSTDTLALPEKLAQRIAAMPAKDQRAASWHVLIGRDGRILQSVPFLRAAWHVGVKGTIAGIKFSSVNRVTVGVELDNGGRLERTKDGLCYVWPFRAKDGKRDDRLRLDSNRAIQVSKEWWDGFTAEQERSATELVRSLVAAYAWTRELCSYGHVHFDPDRKRDPGPVWMNSALPRMLDTLFPPRNVT